MSSDIQEQIERRRDLYRDPSFFKIINYELVRHDMDELLKLYPDLIILDEAQRIKNWRAKIIPGLRADCANRRDVIGVCQRVGGVGARSDH